MKNCKYLTFVVFSLLIVNGIWAQPDQYNHPELQWYSFETDHFFVHFHNGAERTGKVVAKIAEDVYEPITALYGYKPKGKYHFIIRDHDDYSNGGAFFYDNKIEIWATAMDFELRGAHNWLRNVVTHEFTHMISLQASMKITQRIPAFYFQAIGYENERREDVLHGGPNVIASYPLAMMVMPGWFAEGVAQFQVPGLGYETLDSHRDMILRTAALDDKLLTYNEMGVFGKNSLGSEKVYDHGYAFVSYLVENYGLETLQKSARQMKGLFRWTFDGALKKATGKNARQLYTDWVASMRSHYESQVREILPHRVEGDFFESKGLGNLVPTWSPDGAKIAYTTTGNSDYLSQTALVVKDVITGKKQSIGSGVRHAVSWSPDGAQIAYANKSARSKGGSRYFDIYRYDLGKNKKRRVTKGERAHSPHWSHDGRRLVFVTNKDGTENLATVDLSDNNIQFLTQFQNGEKLANPQWSPNGESILFGLSKSNGYDLFLLKLSSGESSALLADPHDSRDAVFSADGQKIYFSWDKTGIFNIYSRDLDSGETQQLTNVIGGAFMPSVNNRGELVFSNFTSDGYKISILKNPQPIEDSKTKYLTKRNGAVLASASNSLPTSLIEEINIHNFDDSKLPDLEAKPYGLHPSPVAILPRVLIDYGTVKLGAYFYSYDVLSKYGFIAGFDVNRRGDFDLFALFEYRNLGPTLFLEGYSQVQNTSSKVEDEDELILRGLESATDKFKFILMEVDAGASFKLSESNELRTAFIFSRYAAKIKIQQRPAPFTVSYRYFIGRDFSLKFIHRGFKRNVHSGINPIGRYVSIGYDREFNKFLKDFKTDQIVNIENFTNFNYNKFTLDWKEFRALPIKDHSLNIEIQAGLIDTKDDTLADGTLRDDSFFYFFGGGILGNRGYPFFSMEGRKILLGRFTYRFPLFRHLDLRFMHMYFDKIFLSVFYDFGNAFNEDSVDFSDFKSSVGAQLRLDTFSFYSYPTKIFFSAAYGLDEFKAANVTYGKEWRFYFGLSFDYLDYR